MELTISLLNFLGQGDYKVPREKAQIMRQHVIYLGLEIISEQWKLGTDRKEAIRQVPQPATVRDLRAFLGMAGSHRLWVSNYGLLIKPLKELLKEASEGPLIWTPESEHAFCDLKMALISAPALGLPDLTKPFELFVYKRQHLALGSSGSEGMRLQQACVVLFKTTRQCQPGMARMPVSCSTHCSPLSKRPGN